MASNALATTGTILNGATGLAVAIDTRGCDSLSIAAPATLPETVNVVSPDGSVIQSPPGTDVVIAAGKTISFVQWPYNSVQLRSSAVGADRIFSFYGQRPQG